MEKNNDQQNERLQRRRERYEKRKLSRSERKYAGGVLSRGIAIILCFVLCLVVFNAINLSSFGLSSSSVIVENKAYDGSDVSLTSYRFSSSTSAFDAIEGGFRYISKFSSDVSAVAKSYLSLITGNEIVQYYYPVVFTYNGVRHGFVVGSSRNDQFLLFRWYTCYYSTLSDVHFVRFGIAGTFWLYSSDSDVNGEFYSSPLFAAWNWDISQNLFFEDLPSAISYLSSQL